MIKEFGEMEITTGKRHSFLGMELTINDNKTILVDMREQVRDVIRLYEAIDGPVDDKIKMPGAAHLFRVDPEGEQLGEVKSKVFHMITATLLYVMQRARQDIEPEIVVLMRRVWSLNQVSIWHS